MTILDAKQTFLFSFLKQEMIKNKTTDLTQDMINSAYRNTVKFLADEENLSKLKQATLNIIKKDARARN